MNEETGSKIYFGPKPDYFPLIGHNPGFLAYMSDIAT
jgi:hypothetical protein